MMEQKKKVFEAVYFDSEVHKLLEEQSLKEGSLKSEIIQRYVEDGLAMVATRTKQPFEIKKLLNKAFTWFGNLLKHWGSKLTGDDSIKDAFLDIFVASQFSRRPAGRVNADGPNSGERFRNEFLVPALNTTKNVRVHLDGVEGFASNWLDEAFGCLISKDGFSRVELRKRLHFLSRDRTIVMEIHQYLDEHAYRRQ